MPGRGHLAGTFDAGLRIRLGSDSKGRPCLPPMEGIADEIMKGRRFAAIRDASELLYEEGGVYRPGGEEFLRRLFRDAVTATGQGRLWNQEASDDVINHVTAMSFCDRSEFDRDRMILNCRNGLVDMRDNRQVRIDGYKSLVQIDTEYRPGPDLGTPEERSRMLNTLLHYLQRLRAAGGRFTHWQDPEETRKLLAGNPVMQMNAGMGEEAG